MGREPWEVVVAVTSPKGGVGKTTCVAHLMVAMLEGHFGWPKNLRVLAIDADPSQYLKERVANLREEISADASTRLQYTRMPVRTLLHKGSSAAFRNGLAEAKRGIDVLMIDVPGIDSAALALSLKVADIAILPVDTSAMGEGGLEGMIEVLRDVLPLNEDLVSVLVPNKLSPRQRAGRLLLDNLGYVDEALGEFRVVYDPSDPITLEHRAVYSIAGDVPLVGREASDIEKDRLLIRPGATALEKPGASGAAGARRDLQRLSAALQSIIGKV